MLVDWTLWQFNVLPLAGGHDIVRVRCKLLGNQRRPIRENQPHLRTTGGVPSQSRWAARYERGEFFGKAFDGFTA